MGLSAQYRQLVTMLRAALLSVALLSLAPAPAPAAPAKEKARDPQTCWYDPGTLRFRSDPAIRSVEKSWRTDRAIPKGRYTFAGTAWDASFSINAAMCQHYAMEITVVTTPGGRTPAQVLNLLHARLYPAPEPDQLTAAQNRILEEGGKLELNEDAGGVAREIHTVWSGAWQVTTERYDFRS